MKKLFAELAERYQKRAGGYTRTFNAGKRRGDNGDIALIELVDGNFKAKTSPAEKSAET